MRFDLHRRYPLLLPALGFVLGIYGAAGGYDPSLGLTLALSGSAILLAWRWPGSRGVAFLGLAILLGAWRAAPFFPPSPPKPLDFGALEKRTVLSVFRVEDYPRCTERYCGSRARLLGWEEDGRFFEIAKTDFTLRIWRAESLWVPGEVYRAELRFSAPRRFKNPHSFNYPEYLRRQGLVALASGNALTPQQRIQTAPAWRARAAVFRQSRLVWLRSVLPRGPGRAILAALLFGEKGELDARLQEVFRRTGLTHVLVVSGLHFAVLLYCFQAPLTWLLAARSRISAGGLARTLAFSLALLPCLFYGLVVGLSPSVLRSLAAVALFAFAWTSGFRKDSLSGLLLIGLLLLLMDPILLFSISFQLSFASVATLSLLAKDWRKLTGSSSKASFLRLRAVRWIGGALASTFGINLALAPWLAGGFHEFSWVAPLSNLVFVPLFTLALPIGVAFSLLGPTDLAFLSKLLGFFHGLVEKIYFLLGALVDKFGASFLVAPWSVFEWLAYFFLMAAIFRVRHWREGILFFTLALCFLGAGELYRRSGIEKGRLSLTMFDVGQGESLLLELPEGQALLMDGGGFPGSSFDLGKNVLAPELLAMGRRRLDVIALSHADADHAKGLAYLLDRLPPREFWMAEAMEGRPGFEFLAERLRRLKIPLRRLSRGQAWEFGGATFEVLWPPSLASEFSDNNTSLVLNACYGEHCFLLTGDIESEAEGSIEASRRPSTVLKVAHHGSKTSSSDSFLRAWQPELALISAGEGNRYRLPHDQVVKSLESRGVVILRSDRDGQIRVSSDGRNLEWRRFRESPLPSRWYAIRAAVFGSGS